MIGKGRMVDDIVEQPLDLAGGVERLLRPAEEVERLRLEDLEETDRHGEAVVLAGLEEGRLIHPSAGEVKFDNYGGHWGDRKELDRFLQAYAIEKAKLEARKKGHSVTEQALADGSIKLTIQVAGGAA